MANEKVVADEQDEVVPAEPETSPSKEYGDAWDEAEEAESGKKPEAAPFEEDEEKEPEVKEPEKKTVPPTKQDKALTGVEKALHDTKKWATDLSTENKRLKDALAAKDSAEKTAKVQEAQEAQKAAQEKLKGSLEAAYSEYPELKEALDGITTQLESTRKELSEIRTADEKRQADRERLASDKQYFEDNIKPKIVAIHKDFDTIVQSPGGEFFKWADTQSPAIRTAVFQSTDPSDMIMALDRFKVDQSSGYIARVKEADAKTKTDKLKNAQSLRGGSGIPDNISSDSADKKNDYDGGWDAAEKALAKEGIT